MKYSGDETIHSAVARVRESIGVKELFSTNKPVDFSKLNNEELVDVITLLGVVTDCRFNNDFWPTVSEKVLVEERLSKEVDSRIGMDDCTALRVAINRVDAKYNGEFDFNIHKRYKVLELWGDREYTSLLKNVVWFMHMVENGIGIESFEPCYLAASKKLSNQFGYEYKPNCIDMYKKEEQEKVGDGQKKEVEITKEFIFDVLNKNWDEAYKLFEKEVDSELNYCVSLL